MFKKSVLKFAFILSCAVASVSANAQAPITTTQNNNKSTTLNVVIDNAIEVVLLKTSPVGIRLATAADYREDVDSTFGDHFQVTSNIPFKIEVKTEHDALGNANGSSIPVGAVSMEVASPGDEHGEVSKIALGNANKTLATAVPATIETPFSIKFSKTETKSKDFLVPGGVYTTNLIITTTQL